MATSNGMLGSDTLFGCDVVRGSIHVPNVRPAGSSSGAGLVDYEFGIGLCGIVWLDYPKRATNQARMDRCRDLIYGDPFGAKSKLAIYHAIG